MLEYILRRTLLFIPTLFVIILLTFLMSLNAPGDPVEQILGNVGAEGRAADMLATEEAYRQVAHRLGLDLPVFYFSIRSLAEPDTLYRISRRGHRKMLRRLIATFGNWQEIQAYYHQVRSTQHAILELPLWMEIRSIRRKLFQTVSELLEETDTARITFLVKELQGTAHQLRMEFAELCPSGNPTHVDSTRLEKCRELLPSIQQVHREIQELQKAWLKVHQQATPWKTYIPAFHWYGTENQFHRWLVSIFTGKFGISYKEQKPVIEVIGEAIRWTLILNLLAVIVIYLIAIPAGVWMAVRKYSWVDRGLSLLFYSLYSLPNFWVATLLIIFLASGVFLAIFPPYGVSSLPPGAPLMDRILDTAHHLVLPVFCLAYPSLAFLARQMRGSMLDALAQDYIRTARAKGLTEKRVVWKHAFRNSLLPIITLFANVFPFMVSGSFVIEYIFAIPGMGKVSYEAILSRDYPVVYAVVLLASVMTLVGYLVADILYAFVDPRISFKKQG